LQNIVGEFSYQVLTFAQGLNPSGISGKKEKKKEDGHFKKPETLFEMP